jgi:putative ABC transport system permease protein
MPLFWLRYSTRSLVRSGRRALFALVCVVVGVAGVVALQTATFTVQNALLSNVRAANGGDISVATDATPLSSRDLNIFRSLQRHGKITAWTAVSSLHATAVGPAGSLVPFDVNVFSPPYPLGGEPTFVTPSNGRVEALIRRPGDVLLTSVLSDELGAHVGDRLLVHSIGGKGLHATVRGILAETSFQHSAVMSVSNRDSAILTTGPPHYVSAYADTPGDPAAAATTLRAAFPVATVQTVQEALQTTEAQVHDFRQFMLLVGLLALMIAGIGILNAVQSILAWRRVEIAMLKAVGFGRGSLYMLFGVEALMLGGIGGVGGTALGAVASKVITDAVATALAVQVTFTVDPGTLVGGVALGALTTLIFSIMPIVRAAAYRPLEILREASGSSPLTSLPPTLGLFAIVVLLLGALAAVTIGNLGLALEFVGGAALAGAVLAGGFALVIGWLSKLRPPRSRTMGVISLIVLVALVLVAVRRAPAVAALLALAAVIWGATVLLPMRRRLALVLSVRSLSRRKGRTSVILVAFLVGVLAMSVTLTVALSLRGQISDAIQSNTTSNLVAVSNAATERQVLSASRDLPGINNRTAVLVLTTTPTAVNGVQASKIVGPLGSTASGDPGDIARGLDGVTGINLQSGDLPAQIRVVGGRDLRSSDAGSSNAVVDADLQGGPWFLHLGDRVKLRETGTNLTGTFTVVGFYLRSGRRVFRSFFTGPIYTDRAFALSLGAGDAQAVVTFSVNPSNLTHDATTLQQQVPGVLVLDIGDLTRVIETILGELLDLLTVITALALGAGLAVVSNGVALAMLERRREIALLKAIGFGPGRVLRFVLVENALVGGIAGAVSIICVLAGLALLSRLALNRAIGYDPVVATLVLLIATGLAIVTAYLTARKPVGIRPIEALRND